MNEAEIRKAEKIKKNAKAVRKKRLSNQKKQTSPLMRLIITVTSFVFVMYCITSIVMTQAEIAEKKQELDVLVEKAEKLEEQNAEYLSILSEEDERAFMERYAVEVLGYAYPNERRFYDTAGK
ncbi:MAG: hypothetical protein K2N26_06330 [Oscillospiraceae bacterium]|nr:hypothetical protein [Oscillospiraceae bacterium]MDE7279326.1 hypothetical protein [Oscillospiraceae bacterium]